MLVTFVCAGMSREPGRRTASTEVLFLRLAMPVDNSFSFERFNQRQRHGSERHRTTRRHRRHSRAGREGANRTPASPGVEVPHRRQVRNPRRSRKRREREEPFHGPPCDDTEVLRPPFAAIARHFPQMAGAEHLPVSAQTLRHRLREHGLLASIDTARQMLLVRRTLEGIPRQVLHLKTRDLVSFSTETSGSACSR